ncbi:RNA polymerase sigma factor [Zafaria sp. J156]|uniref:RNA polymerase sigma factor n=1 Tax=Zafaria sp. J156 TaxID=3116490 RepID=UPI002E76FD5B|nr:sigma-70 family RNA polymerase sigma factor [Zafaria sp. J156]MEE1620501.1 sigma-70 family RNA polymerase sigma factor [Zafaria sp. J156]
MAQTAAGDVPNGPGDAELIGRARGGDAAAFGELFRHHRARALATARHKLDDASLAEDVVSDAFAAMLGVLQRGKGPEEAFGPYLCTVVARMSMRQNLRRKRERPTEDVALFEAGTEHADPVLEGFEAGARAEAFRPLPERWQLVLWHLEIEGATPAEVAPLLSLSPNAVSALGVRARDGLRTEYLQAHVGRGARNQCGQSRQLGAYARSRLGARARRSFERHLESYARCTAALVHVNDVGAGLRGVVAPLFPGPGRRGLAGRRRGVRGRGIRRGRRGRCVARHRYRVRGWRHAAGHVRRRRRDRGGR